MFTVARAAGRKASRAAFINSSAPSLSAYARNVSNLASTTSSAPKSTSSSSSSSSASSTTTPVGIMMLNMGGPSSLDGPVDGVAAFLYRLFSDKEIIMLGPLQRWLGPYIAKKRSPRIAEQYRAIGGKSPIGAWTAYQADAMITKLQHMLSTSSASASSSSSLSFKRYIAFRYAPPLTEDALKAMARDGIKRVVIFSQYPHFSCTTTGSSLNHVWREVIRLGLENHFTWSIIDRWPTHPTFISAVARCVAVGLSKFPKEVRDQVVIVFSAHSVPMLVVNKGDQYVSEVAATVASVMEVVRNGKATLPAIAPPASPPGGTQPGAVETAATSGSSPSSSPSSSTPLDDGTFQASSSASSSSSTPFPPVKSPHILAWQSKVGFLPWMGPPTANVIEGLGKQGHKYVLMVPIAFTSDHIETLFEIDVEYAHAAGEAGILQFERAPSLNGEEALSTAQAQIVAEHLGVIGGGTSRGPSSPSSMVPRVAEGYAATPQYSINCPGCVNPACRTILNPAVPYTKLRDAVSAEANGGCKAIAGSPWPSPEEVKRLKGLKDAHP